MYFANEKKFEIQYQTIEAAPVMINENHIKRQIGRIVLYNRRKRLTSIWGCQRGRDFNLIDATDLPLLEWHEKAAKVWFN